MASTPEPANGSRSFADLQTTSRVTPDDALVIFDSTLAGLAALEARGLPPGHIDAESVIVDQSGHVRLAGSRGPGADDVGAAVRDAALLVTPLIARGGRRMRRVLHLVEAITDGRAAKSAATARGQLAIAANPLGPGWNDRQRLVALVSAPATAAGPRHRRRRLLWGLVAVVLVAAAVVSFLLFRGGTVAPHTVGPLAIGSDLSLHVTPSSGGCNTTFVFDATGSVSGSGPLVYRWEQSDGYATGQATVAVTSNDGGVSLTQAWRIQGTQSFNGVESFHVLKPVDRTVRQPFQYHCP